MLKGIAFALAACFSWGLIFVVPQFMPSFNSIEITLGCYLFYGLISLVMMVKDLLQGYMFTCGRHSPARRKGQDVSPSGEDNSWRSLAEPLGEADCHLQPARESRTRVNMYLQGKCRYSKAIWYKAFVFSLISAIIYYSSVVVALRYATPTICALILGINPIAISFYGNWKKKECRNRTLFLPAVLVILGLLIINVPQFSAADSPTNYLLGLLAAVCGLASWGWYVVENSHFLKDNPDVASDDWATLVGVTTLGWFALIAVILGIFFGDSLDTQKYLTLDTPLYQFLIGCGVLGLICTWLGAYLWNLASAFLPVSLLGQLAIFETIFGLLFVYTIDQRLPASTEAIGITLLLGAVVYGIRNSSKSVASSVSQPAPQTVLEQMPFAINE